MKEQRVDQRSNSFPDARWKVFFSENFKDSLAKIESLETKMEVMCLLVKLSTGLRPGKNKSDFSNDPSSKCVFCVKNIYVVCSTDIQKESDRHYCQILKVWDFLSVDHVSDLISRLDIIFNMYSNDYEQKCRAKQIEGDLEIPMEWKDVNVVKFKSTCRSDGSCDCSFDDRFSDMERCQFKVDDSLLIMKFYPLTPPIVRYLMSECDIKYGISSFEVTDQEHKAINFKKSAFITGRSGTGKTTILAMKLLQNEEWYNSNFGQNVDEIRQLYVTASPRLCNAIEKQISHLDRIVGRKGLQSRNGSLLLNMIDGVDVFSHIPNSLIKLPIEYYPLIITTQKLLLMLDGSIGSSFFRRFIKKQDRLRHDLINKIVETKQVDFEKFCSKYWQSCTETHTRYLEPLMVFTEIISHIKGGLYSGYSSKDKLGRGDYLQLPGRRGSPFTTSEREQIYDIFTQYESVKKINCEFDSADFVNDLQIRFRHNPYRGDKFQFVYIDEVQDLTMKNISLLKHVCRNVDDGFVFCGDTAKTIARGIDFRFEDIRNLFYSKFLLNSRCGKTDERKDKCCISPIFQLTGNHRTHKEIQKISQSVLDILYYFFPSYVDILQPEFSMVGVDSPVILISSNGEDAIDALFGKSTSQDCGSSMAKFGTKRVVLVRDDKTRNCVFSRLGYQAHVLTIFESKGLEFEDVLLFDFFDSSPLTRSQWRVIDNFSKEEDMIVGSPKPCPHFDDLKHASLCGELKLLYVAITRTRQRLWICESGGERSEPMFGYWKRQGLAREKAFHSHHKEKYNNGKKNSNYFKEELNQLGMELFKDGMDKSAADCFQQAGVNHCRNGALRFEAVGSFEFAATCYLHIHNFRKAGDIYMNNLKEYRKAADTYALGRCVSECLEACTKGKLFEVGLAHLRSWEPLHISEVQFEKRFLESRERAQANAVRVKPAPIKVKPAPTRVEPNRVEPTPARVKPTPTRVEPTPVRVEPRPVRVEPTTIRGGPMEGACRRQAEIREPVNSCTLL